MKLILPALLSLTLTNDAWAYLDPGSSSYLIQVIVGVAAGALFTVRQYWSQIKAFWHKLTKKKNKDE